MYIMMSSTHHNAHENALIMTQKGDSMYCSQSVKIAIAELF